MVFLLADNEPKLQFYFHLKKLRSVNAQAALSLLRDNNNNKTVCFGSCSILKCLS